jgi:non-ribosomal peptide synthetase component F
VEELKPPREPGANPVYQVEFTLLTYEHAPAVYNYGFRSAVDVSLDLADLSLSPMDVESGVSKFDLVILLWDVPGGIRGTFEYDEELFDAATIHGMAARFEALLAYLVDQPDERLARLAERTGAPRKRPLTGPGRGGPRRARRRALGGPTPKEEGEARAG